MHARMHSGSHACMYVHAALYLIYLKQLNDRASPKLLHCHHFSNIPELLLTEIYIPVFPSLDPNGMPDSQTLASGDFICQSKTTGAETLSIPHVAV